VVKKTLLSLLLTLTITGAARSGAAPERKSVLPKTVVLTFDDAVKTHLTVVAPLLKQLRFRAVTSVVASKSTELIKHLTLLPLPCPRISIAKFSTN